MILVILDEEEDYLYGIREYFQEKLKKYFDIYSFHTKDAFIKFAKERQKEIDVFLGSEELLLEEKKIHKVKQCIYLSSGRDKSNRIKRKYKAFGSVFTYRKVWENYFGNGSGAGVG